MKGTPLIKVDNYKVTLHETVQWDDEVASWERANSIVRFLGLLDDETSGEDLLPFETATLCVSHTTPRLSNTFLLSLSFVARDRNTWEGYKFNFIPRLNIISADIYGKYHAIVCCVTIKHRFIILSYSILDICCSNNIAGRYFFQTVLSTEISPTVNNYRYQWSKINSLKKERRRKNKCILDIHAYTYITRRRRQRRWLKEEALSFRIHLPKWILVRYSFTFTCREFSLFLSKSVALFIARIDL